MLREMYLACAPAQLPVDADLATLADDWSRILRDVPDGELVPTFRGALAVHMIGSRRDWPMGASAVWAQWIGQHPPPPAVAHSFQGWKRALGLPPDATISTNTPSGCPDQAELQRLGTEWRMRFCLPARKDDA